MREGITFIQNWLHGCKFLFILANSELRERFLLNEIHFDLIHLELTLSYGICDLV